MNRGSGTRFHIIAIFLLTNSTNNQHHDSGSSTLSVVVDAQMLDDFIGVRGHMLRCSGFPGYFVKLNKFHCERAIILFKL